MFYSLFDNILRKNELRKSLVLFCLLIGMVVLMRFFNIPLKNEIAPAGIVSFELAKDIAQSTLMINSWDAEAISAAKKSLYADFLFLCIYSTFFALLIFKLNKKLNLKTHYLSEILMGAIFLSAFFDVVENLALLQLIYGNLEQFWSAIAYYFAVLKFTILAIATLCILGGSCLLLFKKIRKA